MTSILFHPKRRKISSTLQTVTFSKTTGAQTPGARSPWQLNLVWWRQYLLDLITVLNHVNFLEHIIFYVAPGKFAPLHNTLFLSDRCHFVSSLHYRVAHCASRC